jgi:hypothetical protein
VRWEGNVTRIGKKKKKKKKKTKNVCANFVGKPKGERLLGRERRRWEDNINMGLRGIG